MAQRIQRKRTRGWRTPEDAIYVGRPTKWGNPFRVGGRTHYAGFGGCWIPVTQIDQLTAVTLYRNWVNLDCRYAVGAPPTAADLENLRGHDLACWCPLDKPCHADVLLDIANR